MAAIDKKIYDFIAVIFSYFLWVKYVQVEGIEPLPSENGQFC